MNVKVHCLCGTRFEFPVEPVNERMPVAIACPVCGADTTEIANDVIRKQLAAAAPMATAPTPVATAVPSAPRIVARVSTHSVPAVSPSPSGAAPPPPAPPSSASLRINRSAAPAAESGAGPEGAPVRKCARHTNEVSTEVCCVCGKPICLKCMEVFGYVCSVYCREQAPHKKIDIPEFAGQKSLIETRSNRKVRKTVLTVCTVVGLIVSTWIWYTWFARTPKVIYTADFAAPHYLDKVYRVPDYYRLIAPNQLLAIKEKSVILMDAKAKKPFWTTPLRTEAEAKAADAARAKNDSIREKTPKFQDEHGNTVQRLEGLDPLEYFDDHAFDEPHAIATTNDIWVTFENRVIRLDRQTGAKKDFTLPDAIAYVVPAEDYILVGARTAAGAEVVTRIQMPDGSLQTEETKAAPAKPKTTPGTTATAAQKQPAAGTPTTLIRGARVTPGTPADAMGGAPKPRITEKGSSVRSLSAFDLDIDLPERIYHPSFIPAGDNVVEFNVKLVEHRSLPRPAKKAQPAPTPAPPKKTTSVLDNKNLNASQSLEVAEEILGRPTKDFGDDLDIDYTDVSVYQFTLHRFFAKDSSNFTAQMVGEPIFAPLTTVDLVAGTSNLIAFDKSNKKLWEAKLSSPVSGHAPCVETKDAIYLADGGTLARYDKSSGTVQWRLPSIGVSSVQADDKGFLYVDTTTAQPKGTSSGPKGEKQILKVNPADGKILWHKELGSRYMHLMTKGSFLYSERSWETQDITRLGEGADVHYSLRMLSPSSGGVVWSYSTLGHDIVKTEILDKWIMLHFQDKVIVLKFFSL